MFLVVFDRSALHRRIRSVMPTDKAQVIGRFTMSDYVEQTSRPGTFVSLFIIMHGFCIQCASPRSCNSLAYTGTPWNLLDLHY